MRNIDFSSDIDTEETILRLLGDYYQTDKFYVPPRTPGSGLPRAFIDFYNYLLDQTARNLLEEEKEQLANVCSLCDSLNRCNSSLMRYIS